MNNSKVDYFKQSIPVQVQELAQELGLNVELKPLPDGVAGRLVRRKDDPSRYRIEVAIKDHPRRQRFTIAHEIAHYFLHRDLSDRIEDSTWYRSSLSNEFEWQANLYAADLLMPFKEIEERINNGFPNAKELAKEFDVSPAAMEIRLEEVRRKSLENNQRSLLSVD